MIVEEESVTPQMNVHYFHFGLLKCELNMHPNPVSRNVFTVYGHDEFVYIRCYVKWSEKYSIPVIK